MPSVPTCPRLFLITLQFEHYHVAKVIYSFFQNEGVGIISLDISYNCLKKRFYCEFISSPTNLAKENIHASHSFN